MYKDPKRPIINENQRAKMVASIRFVDFVYISDTSTSSPETLQLLKPDNVVFCKEANKVEKMRQRMKNIENFSPGTKVWFLPRYDEEEISTGSIIRKIREE
jgi:glycerol-3-phosphate cytidylyltransferase-like family protein